MDKLQRYLGQILFHSTFGVTLLTTTAMILILWFLIKGTRPVSVVAESADDGVQAASSDTPQSPESLHAKSGDLSSPAATSGARVQPSDRYAGNRGDSTPRVAPKYVARLTRTCNCRWAENTEALQEGASLRAGQTLHVATGLAEIAFACGAKAILDGPVVLEIESTKTAVLHSGKLTANVPDDLEGFTIRTAVVEIVALPAGPTVAKGQSGPASKASAKAVSKAGAKTPSAKSLPTKS